jgi:dimethylargininase
MKALVRAVPLTFPLATAEKPVVINLEQARTQHHLYVSALASRVEGLIWADPLDASPDSVFVEDQVVVASGQALLCRSGHPGRRSERNSIAMALSRWLTLHEMTQPATLDGGDVLRLGQHFFVGSSSRSNEEGASWLERVFGPLGYVIHRVPVPDDLHLKCVCSALSATTVVAVEGRLPTGCFEGIADVIMVSSDEAYGANLVAVDQSVIMASGSPKLQALIASRGFAVTVLDLSEIRKGDGALTCMSVLF